jgi:outer membrane protease
MKLATILSFLLIPFLNFAQEQPDTEFSVEVGVKYTFMAKTSNGGSYPCSGQQCYHLHDLDKAKTIDIQVYIYIYIQLSYTRNRFILPLGIGYTEWEEELNGADREGLKLFDAKHYETST